jgi:peptidoglycan-associated lipoprotein
VVRNPVAPIVVDMPGSIKRDTEVIATPVQSEPETNPDNFAVLPEKPGDITASVFQINGELQDVFFDYDRAELRADAVSALRHDASLLIPILRGFPELTVIVEGHCDDRGSAEYNLGLGGLRSARAVEILRRFGVPAERIQDISYGKERPQCIEAVESCRQKNRRVHLLLR